MTIKEFCKKLEKNGYEYSEFYSWYKKYKRDYCSTYYLLPSNKEVLHWIKYRYDDDPIPFTLLNKKQLDKHIIR